jgi:hypothetical protein
MIGEAMADGRLCVSLYLPPIPPDASVGGLCFAPYPAHAALSRSKPSFVDQYRSLVRIHWSMTIISPLSDN